MTEEGHDKLKLYVASDEIIGVIKAIHNITEPNDNMTDKEIGDVMRYLGEEAPDTIWADDKPVMGRKGFGIMLSLSLYEFPEFYQRHELWQRN